jgi:hypothetical protein
VETKIVSWEQICFFAHHRLVSAVKKVDFVSDMMSCIVLRGRWCNIVLIVHVPSEEKSDESNDSFFEELEQVFFIIFLSTI